MLDPNATLETMKQQDNIIAELRATNATLMHQNAQLTQENETYKRKSAAYNTAIDQSLAQANKIFNLQNKLFLQTGRNHYLQRENAANMALMEKVIEAYESNIYLSALEENLIPHMRAHIATAKFIAQNSHINTEAITEYTNEQADTVSALNQKLSIKILQNKNLKRRFEIAYNLLAEHNLTRLYDMIIDIVMRPSANCAPPAPTSQSYDQTNNAPGTNASAKTKETDPMHEADAQTIGAPETEQPKEDTPLQQEQYRNVLGGRAEAFPPPIPTLTQQMAHIKAAIDQSINPKSPRTIKYVIHHHNIMAEVTTN